MLNNKINTIHERIQISVIVQVETQVIFMPYCSVHRNLKIIMGYTRRLNSEGQRYRYIHGSCRRWDTID